MKGRIRSRFEMVVDFLDSIERHPTLSFTQVSRFAKLNGGKTRDTILNMLVDRGFVVTNVVKTPSYYKEVINIRLTSVGFAWLRKAQSLSKEIF